MSGRAGLVGRQAELERLADALDRARSGAGALVLVAGEAGVGKTALTDALAAGAPRVLRGAATHGRPVAYGPVVAAFRSCLRGDPDALASCGPLTGHLATILPELGARAEATDRPTLFEAVRCAFAKLAEAEPLLVVLEDLHWSDAATLELLAALAEPFEQLPVFVIATYRSDGLPRDHGLRRLRNELRRAGRLDELALEPLDADAIAGLVAAALGAAPSPTLARVVHDRSQGVPFFAEELARALLAAGALRRGAHGLELADPGDLPVPDTIRDAVLLGAAEISGAARAAAEAAAVAGEVFDLDLVAEIASDRGLEELLRNGLVAEDQPGQARFRHALAREALYADIPWTRRRALHRQLAVALERRGAPAAEFAAHWLGARDPERARASLLAAACEAEAVHAYRDAAAAGRHALELWPGDAAAAQDPARIAALERYGQCCELAGDLSEAIRAWRELSEIRGLAGEAPSVAHVQRRLAAAYDLKGEREPALAARRLAAEAFVEAGLPAEAAVDHLAIANQLRLTGKHSLAAEPAAAALEEATRADRPDLRARALGLHGLVIAKASDYELGLATVREGLALALEHDLSVSAAELYQRLSIVLYEAADYRQAAEALDTALDLCRRTGRAGVEEACVSCLAYVLRDLGEWQEAANVCRDMVDAEQSTWVAEGLLGSIHAYQGRFSSARRLLNACLAQALRADHYNMTIDSSAALAFVAAAEGATEEARSHGRALLARWEQSEDRHYALSGLRWAAAWFARSGDRAGAHACTDALSRIASSSGQPEALAALAHAIAELALLEGDSATAAEQLTGALELHRTIDMPFVRAQIEVRAGVALAAAGETDLALERLSGAYRTARKLGARPLAAEAAREATALGSSVVQRLGRGAHAEAAAGGLSRRECEVVRLLAVGRTNREIAQELFLSQRTVDMHVRNILRKLDCRSRVEAANRANALGLVVSA